MFKFGEIQRSRGGPYPLSKSAIVKRTMAPPEKIAFFKISSFSHTNESVALLLRRSFRRFHVETIDVFQELINKFNPIYFLFALKEYGTDIVYGKKDIRECIWRTPYFFRKMKTAASNRLLRNEYAFSFQTQSIFDASIPRLPHFVYTDHTHLANLKYPCFDQKKLLSNKWIALEKSIYHNATLNFTMSTNISKSIVDQYDCHPRKVKCVYAGSNAKIIKRQQNCRDYTSKNILFVGVDWERKGGPELVEAFKIIIKKHTDAKLTIVGCSPNISISNVRVIGRVPIEKMHKYYEEASIFCLPTKLEPFGIVFIEALLHKLPIVATNIGALPDFIKNGENGYLVEPYDVQQLAASLSNLLTDSMKCRMFGEKGSLIAKEGYSWEKVGLIIKQNIEQELIRYRKATMG